MKDPYFIGYMITCVNDEGVSFLGDTENLSWLNFQQAILFKDINEAINILNHKDMIENREDSAVSIALKEVYLESIIEHSYNVSLPND